MLKKPAPSPRVPIPSQILEKNEASKEACPRCRQGFFCSDHGINIQFLSQSYDFENLQMILSGLLFWLKRGVRTSISLGRIRNQAVLP